MSKLTMKHLNNYQPMKLDNIFISDVSLDNYELPNGDFYKGSYDSQGLRHGYGLYMFRDGTRYLGNYHHGQRSGYGLMSYIDGSKYAGTWHNNLKHGYGLYTYRNGALYEGQWFENRRHGIGTYDEENSSFYGTWIKGQRCGPAEINVKFFQLYAIYQDHCPVGPALFTFGEKWMCGGYFLKETSMDKSSPSFWVPQQIARYDPSKIPPRPEPELDLDQIEIISSTSSFSSWLFSAINSDEGEFVSKPSSVKSVSEALDQFKIIDDIASSIIRMVTMRGAFSPQLTHENLTKLHSVILSLKSFLSDSGIQTPPPTKAEMEIESTQSSVGRKDSRPPSFLDSTSALTASIEIRTCLTSSSFKESSLSSADVPKAKQISKEPSHHLPEMVVLNEEISTAAEVSLQQIENPSSEMLSTVLTAAYSDTKSIFDALDKFQIVDDITDSIVRTVLNADRFVEDVELMRKTQSKMNYILDIILNNVVRNKLSSN